MKLANRDLVVQYLLNQITYTMMAKSPVKEVLQKAAARHEAKLKAVLTEEEYKPIGVMRNTVDQLVKLLVNCQSVAELEKVHAYLEDLNDGKMLIMGPDTNPPANA